jgi:hypothetical protein
VDTFTGRPVVFDGKGDFVTEGAPDMGAGTVVVAHFNPDGTGHVEPEPARDTAPVTAKRPRRDKGDKPAKLGRPRGS